MSTTSTLSKKSTIDNCISINTLSPKKIIGEPNITNSHSSGEKAIVIDIVKRQSAKKDLDAKLTYTLKLGDAKRLNKNGILRVYHVNEPIDIPVKKLLGKWKTTHVGATFIVKNGKWCVEGNSVKNISVQKSSVLVAFQRFLKLVKA